MITSLCMPVFECNASPAWNAWLSSQKKEITLIKSFNCCRLRQLIQIELSENFAECFIHPKS
jgi:hypothetical protein